MERNSTFKITKTALAARAWPATGGLAGVAHAFSTRHVTAEVFFGRAFPGAEKLRPVLLRQVHSDVVHAVDRPPKRLLRGDALITATPGLALVVKTADCLPILLCDPAARAAGIVHAGWRGTARRITEKAVGAMRAHYRAEPSRMRAVIGPGIHACCYQVGQEVLDAFRAQFAYAEELFRNFQPENPADIRLPRQVMSERTSIMLPPSTTSAHLDLEEANRRQLLDAGLRLGNIVTGAPCTACRTDLLYSYRREGPATGRLYALIALRPK